MPELADHVARENAVDVQGRAAWIYNDVTEPTRTLEQLCGTSFLCQVHARFSSNVLGLRPQAKPSAFHRATNVRFILWARGAESANCWTKLRRAGFIREFLRGKPKHSGAETGPITGFRRRSRKFLRRSSRGTFGLRHHIECSRRSGNRGQSRGLWADCAPGLASHRCARLSMELSSLSHCPAVQPAAQLWRRLHARPTVQPAGIRFYSNALGASYALSSDSVADALTQQALEMVDFPRTIRAAWNDGVRIFVEHGPRSQCTQSIRTILGDRPHLAVPLDTSGRSSLRQALYAAAELWCAGVPVDVAALRARLDLLGAPQPETGAWLKFPPPILPCRCRCWQCRPRFLSCWRPHRSRRFSTRMSTSRFWNKWQSRATGWLELCSLCMRECRKAICSM